MNPVHGIAAVTGAGHARRKGKHQVWQSTFHMFVDEMQLNVKFTLGPELVIKDMDFAKVCLDSLTKSKFVQYVDRSVDLKFGKNFCKLRLGHTIPDKITTDQQTRLKQVTPKMKPIKTDQPKGGGPNAN